MKAYVIKLETLTSNPSHQAMVMFHTGSGIQEFRPFTIAINAADLEDGGDYQAIRQDIVDAIITYANGTGWGSAMVDADVFFGTPNVMAKGQTRRSYDHAPSRSIETVAAAANGFQLSETHDAEVNYAVTIESTATIGSPASGTVVLEIAETNSATAGDWTEIDRFTNGIAVTLGLSHQSVETQAKSLYGLVPAGWYVRLRSINTLGTPSYTFNSGQEVLVAANI